MAKIKTIDTRVVKAFENSSREDIVKYLEWLRATIEVLSQNIRRTIGLALVLIAAFGLVNTSSNTVITVGSFKLSGGSIVAIFIPAIASFLLYQAATDTNRLNILQEAFSKVFSIWSPAGENNDVDLWVLPSYALYWNVSTFSERRLFRTLPDTLQSLLEDIIFAVVVIGMIGFQVLAYAVLHHAASHYEALWLASIRISAFLLGRGAGASYRYHFVSRIR